MNASFSTVSPLQLDFNCLSAQICAIGDALRRRQWQVTCAESCTGGGVACAFTSVAGSSDWFAQSFVTYSNNAKQRLVGVGEQSLTTWGAVSEQVVAEMAKGASVAADAECAVAVSGIAGPGGGSLQKPVGTVWFAVKIGNDLYCQQCLFTGDRQQVRAQAISFAVQLLYSGLVESAL